MNKDNKNITVLVVDDDPDFLIQHKALLENAGYSVITADSEKAAEQLLEKQMPDLAIVDLMMEHADGGFALCYHIKKRNQDIPVIIVTAVASETGLDFDVATNEERSWVKADAFLSKPVRFEQMQREINRLLNN